MPAIISRSIRDMGDIELVSVIASFDTDGHITPLYVRIGRDSYKIASSYQKDSYDAVLTFQCQLIDNDYLKPLVLKYFIHEAAWTIPRMPHY